MIAGLVAHLWQSTLFAGTAWLLTLALRKNRAQVRYRIWFIASIKFLVPFSLLVGLGTLVPRREVAPPTQTGWVGAAEQLGQPLFTIPAVAARVAGASDGMNRNYFAAAALIVWTCGLVTIAFCWLVRWKRVRGVRRSARPVMIPGSMELAVPVMAAPGLVEPGIFGIFRPVLLLPEGIEEQLDREQLDAILVHELCHVHRHDNLTAAIHMVVQATFWFHPLVWWLGAHLVDERERACDEEVLRLGSKPQIYAAGILNVCKLYVEAPLVCVSGVTGSNLKKRIDAIMKNRIVPRLSSTTKVALAVVGTAAVAVPIIVGITYAPAVRAQVQSSIQSGTAAAPKFEVASIKLCKDGDFPVGRGGGGGTRWSPGRLIVNCENVASLIPQAYLNSAERAVLDAHFVRLLRQPVRGGPSWIDSELYRIEAKVEGAPSIEMMKGPMMKALLEDRFKLKVHRETREIPVYALSVAKGGPRLQVAQKGSCITVDRDHPFSPPAEGQPMPRVCGGVDGRNGGLETYGQTMAGLCFWLSGRLDREVIDKTGIAGMFNIHLDAPRAFIFPGLPADGTPGGLNDSGGPDPADIFSAIQTAVQRLGLRLERTKGPDQFLVIDHVEKPSEN